MTRSAWLSAFDTQYKQLSCRLLDVARNEIPTPSPRLNREDDNSTRLNLIDDLYLGIHDKTQKPYCISLLYKKRQIIFNIDLTDIVLHDGLYYWYLKMPKGDTNKQVIHNEFKWAQEFPEVYISAVKNIKSTINTVSNVHKCGYCLCEKASQEELESTFVGLINVLISKHPTRTIHKLVCILKVPTDTHLFVHASEDITKEPDVISHGRQPITSFKERVVAQTRRGTRQARLRRLASAPRTPLKIFVTSSAFERNPDVVAEVLSRADGICEACGESAPFLRRTDGSPYLEVHHSIQLTNGGEDTVENAVGLCPNCHRRAHYG